MYFMGPVVKTRAIANNIRLVSSKWYLYFLGVRWFPPSDLWLLDCETKRNITSYQHRHRMHVTISDTVLEVCQIAPWHSTATGKMFCTNQRFIYLFQQCHLIRSFLYFMPIFDSCTVESQKGNMWERGCDMQKTSPAGPDPGMWLCGMCTNH